MKSLSKIISLIALSIIPLTLSCAAVMPKVNMDETFSLDQIKAQMAVKADVEKLFSITGVSFAARNLQKQNMDATAEIQTLVKYLGCADKKMKGMGLNLSLQARGSDGTLIEKVVASKSGDSIVFQDSLYFKGNTTESKYVRLIGTDNGAACVFDYQMTDTFPFGVINAGDNVSLQIGEKEVNLALDQVHSQLGQAFMDREVDYAKLFNHAVSTQHLLPDCK